MLLLEQDGISIDLDEVPLLHITKVDYGFPDIREVTDNRVDANGMVDRTMHFGARAVTLEGHIAIGRRQQVIDLLAPFTNPAARPVLTRLFDDGSLRRIQLRASGATAAIVAGVRDIQLQWKAPLGILESGGPDGEHTQTLIPAGVVQGRIYPLVFPRTYPATGGGTIQVINNGAIPCDWVAHVFGPISNPKITNETTNQSVVLNHAIAANDWVTLSSYDRVVLDRGEPTATRYSWLDYANTTWFQLQPGANGVYLTTRNGTSLDPAQAHIHWRDAYVL